VILRSTPTTDGIVILLDSRRRAAARLLLLGASLMLAACASAKPDATASTPTAFAGFADDYFDALYAFAPSQGTAAGFHQYDAKLEDLSASAHSARAETLHRLQGRLDTLRAGRLSADDVVDAAMIDGAIRSELLELETVQGWRHNPMGYVGLPGGAIDGLMKRDFAPAGERLRSVTARLRGIPAVLAAMRANVENPPREFTDLAIRIASGSVGFFHGTVAEWARTAAGNDTVSWREFSADNDSAAAAMDAAAKWLTRDLLPRSKGRYAIGAETFAAKLRYEEMVDTPLDSLLAIGEANLRKDHDALVAMAREIDPGKTTAQVIAGLADDHPTADSLIPFVRGSLESARQFLIDRKIVTIPSEVRPKVEETPPYARAGGFASMDTPGAYESKATEAFYYVTPPERNWDAKHVEEHLRLFNRPVTALITVHEVFPGHFLQFIYAKQFPTKTRKLMAAASNSEGWAHYSEQMMIDEGFGGGDPRVRLAQLSEALVRDCRYVVGIKLHTQDMTVEDGAKCFTEQGFQEPTNAYEEARRGAYNPTYLYYTLGKLQIYKLRDDYRRAKGSTFTLQEFHDAFVRQGGVPLKLMRQLLLPGDTGPTL
jgi:uncharacterized protein (DUF885 family)